MLAVCLTSVASAFMAFFTKAFPASSSEPTLGEKDCLLATLLVGYSSTYSILQSNAGRSNVA